MFVTNLRKFLYEEKYKMQSKSTFAVNNNINVAKRLDETVLEQICDAIFTLIPEVPRLKQLFLSWCLLNSEERMQLDSKVQIWYSSSWCQLYKPLREALVRWENVQDTQGAPGCEPGIVSFSCDPQLEEELVSVICDLEMMFTENKGYKREIGEENRSNQHSDFIEKISHSIARNNMQTATGPKVRTSLLHSVHSCNYITDNKNSDDELGGYMTN